jgi:hypothetical protein
MGSPVTYKELWDDSNYTKTKYILRKVDSIEELRRIEPKLIKEAWKRDGKDVCLNRHAAPYFHPDVCVDAGRIGGKKCKENGLGIFALTKEQRSEIGKKTFELGKGIFALTKEQRSEIGKKALTKEQRSEIGKKTFELGIGIHALTKEQRSEHSKISGKISAEKRAINFCLISPIGEVIRGRNVRKFARENNLDPGHIRKVISGKSKQHKGYTRYDE